MWMTQKTRNKGFLNKVSSVFSKMRRGIKLLTETSDWIFGGRANVCMLVCVGFFGFLSVAED